MGSSDNLSNFFVKIDFVSPGDMFDLKRLYFIDLSNWKHLKSDVDYPKYIDIKVPGSSKYVRNYFTPNTWNVYGADSLNLQSSAQIDELCPLPDGIYYAKVFICDGVDFSEEKMFFRYDALRHELNKKIRASYLPCSESNRELFREIYEYIEGAKGMAMENDADGAMRLYEKVKEKMKFL